MPLTPSWIYHFLIPSHRQGWSSYSDRGWYCFPFLGKPIISEEPFNWNPLQVRYWLADTITELRMLSPLDTRWRLWETFWLIQSYMPLAFSKQPYAGKMLLELSWFNLSFLLGPSTPGALFFCLVRTRGIRHLCSLTPGASCLDVYWCWIILPYTWLLNLDLSLASCHALSLDYSSWRSVH